LGQAIAHLFSPWRGYHRDHLFAPLFIGNADDRGILNQFGRQDGSFYLGGEHLLSTRDNQFLGPTDHVQVPGGVQIAQVSGWEWLGKGLLPIAMG
jgi:hypothetical protein